MDRLEILAHAEVADGSRDLLAMQALAREVLASDAPRLAPLARTLRRDLDAAINGTATPWTTTRTRLEARKLARLATSRAPQPAPFTQTRAARPAAHPSDERNELLHVGAALTALALWLAWAARLRGTAAPARRRRKTSFPFTHPRCWRCSPR